MSSVVGWPVSVGIVVGALVDRKADNALWR